MLLPLLTSSLEEVPVTSTSKKDSEEEISLRTLEVARIDETTQVPLEGVVFELRDKNNLLMATATTDVMGKVAFTGLIAGIPYNIIETVPATGYSLDTQHAIGITLDTLPEEVVEGPPLVEVKSTSHKDPVFPTEPVYPTEPVDPTDPEDQT